MSLKKVADSNLDQANESETKSKDNNVATTSTTDDSEHHSVLYDMHHSPENIKDLFREGIYPYKTKLKRKPYEKKKKELQAELLKAQNWIKETGQRFILLFEGRDAAGKGGTIKRFMEHLNPRSARVVALEKPASESVGNGTFNVIFNIFRPAVKLCFMTVPGTTARVLSESWVFVLQMNTLSICVKRQIWSG